VSHPYTIIVIVKKLTSYEFLRKEDFMLYVIRRSDCLPVEEHVQGFSTLAEAQARFDELRVSNPSWNLQILAETQE
jgi:hypothetical protein